MGQLKLLVIEHAADLLFNFAAFLLVYVIARMCRANPLLAMCIAVLPPLVAYLMQHPGSTSSLMAMLR